VDQYTEVEVDEQRNTKNYHKEFGDKMIKGRLKRLGEEHKQEKKIIEKRTKKQRKGKVEAAGRSRQIEKKRKKKAPLSVLKPGHFGL
jgi:hypothetical protein